MKWTPELDRKLKDAISAGETRRGWARKMGVSESAVIARYNRIMGVVFPSDAEKRRAAIEAATKKKKRQEQHERAVLKKAERLRSRDAAVQFARCNGVRLATIGSHFGFTGERARQIAAGL